MPPPLELYISSEERWPHSTATTRLLFVRKSETGRSTAPPFQTLMQLSLPEDANTKPSRLQDTLIAPSACAIHRITVLVRGICSFATASTPANPTEVQRATTLLVATVRARNWHNGPKFEHSFRLLKWKPLTIAPAISASSTTPNRWTTACTAPRSGARWTSIGAFNAGVRKSAED
jgi:hypothetical protein